MPKSCPTEPVAEHPRDKEKQRERQERDRGVRGVRKMERKGEENSLREVTEKKGKLIERCLRRCRD